MKFTWIYVGFMWIQDHIYSKWIEIYIKFKWNLRAIYDIFMRDLLRAHEKIMLNLRKITWNLCWSCVSTTLYLCKIGNRRFGDTYMKFMWNLDVLCMCKFIWRIVWRFKRRFMSRFMRRIMGRLWEDFRGHILWDLCGDLHLNSSGFNWRFKWRFKWRFVWRFTWRYWKRVTFLLSLILLKMSWTLQVLLTIAPNDKVKPNMSTHTLDWGGGGDGGS